MIESSWSAAISEALIQKLHKGESRYNLVILDQERSPIHIFNDVQWYQTFSKDLSGTADEAGIE